jgi:hypothetical protein
MTIHSQVFTALQIQFPDFVFLVLTACSSSNTSDTSGEHTASIFKIEVARMEIEWGISYVVNGG